MKPLDFLSDGTVQIWPEKYAVCKVKNIVENAFAVVQDKQEITIIIEAEKIPKESVLEVETGWKIITFDMVLPFELVGFLAIIATKLAEINVSIFAISAFSTDHVLVKETDLDKTIQQLKGLGCKIQYL